LPATPHQVEAPAHQEAVAGVLGVPALDSPLLDSGGLGGRMDGAVELVDRQRRYRVAARKQPAPR